MDKKLNPKQELFCQNYVNNRETFGNGTISYAGAYGLDVSLNGSEEQKSQYWSANVCAAQLLAIPSIKDRVVKLLNDLLKDEIVDGELSKVIQQDNELGAKVSAIREWYKVKGRYAPEKHDVNFGRKPTEALDKEEVNRLMEVFEK